MNIVPAPDLFRFEWHVPSHGYQWRDARDAGNARARVLTAGVIQAQRTIHPFEQTPALFRVFADVQPTERAILAFVNQYGALGLDVDVTLDARAARGETLATWTDEITFMRHALYLIKVVEQGDERVLRRLITIDAERGRLKGAETSLGVTTVIYHPAPALLPLVGTHQGRRLPLASLGETVVVDPLIAAQIHGQRGAARGTPPDTVPTARAAGAVAIVRQIVNARLSAHTCATILSDATQRGPVPVAVHLTPKNLAGAMWLQVALAMAGEDYRQCEECGMWFKVKPQGRRTETRFHAGTCRARAAYKRNKIAETKRSTR